MMIITTTTFPRIWKTIVEVWLNSIRKVPAHEPDPIDTKVTQLEEELLLRVVTIEESLVAAEEDVAQLQADNKELQANNKELLLRVASIEESIAAAGAKNTGSGKSMKKQKTQIQK